jgi:hypothetical protein
LECCRARARIIAVVTVEVISRKIEICSLNLYEYMYVFAITS